MWDLTGGIIFICMGCFFLIFNGFIAEKTASYFKKQPAWIGFLISDVSFDKGLFFFGGLIFVAFGIKLVL